MSVEIRSTVADQPSAKNAACAAEQKLIEWSNNALLSREVLLQVQLDLNRDRTISADYLREVVGIPYDTICNHSALQDVVGAMEREKIIVPGYASEDCEARRIALCWYEGLSDEEKINVPLKKMRVVHKGYLDRIPRIKNRYCDLPLYNLTRDEIAADVMRIRGSMPMKEASTECSPEYLGATRAKSGDIDQRLASWKERVLSSREHLLSVQLNVATHVGISISYLAKELEVSASSANKRKHQPDVIQAMIREKIIVPEYGAAENEWRRKILRWYSGLSEDEKANIPISANRVKKKGFLDQIEEIAGALKTSQNKLISATFDEIRDDVLRITGNEGQYKTVKEREADRASVVKVETVSARQVFYKLRDIEPKSYADLVVDPDVEFSQVLHLFASASVESHSKSGQSNFYEGWRFFSAHLKALGLTGIETAKELLGEHSLSRFRAFLEEKLLAKEISSATANTLFSSTRKMLASAVSLPGLGFSDFYDQLGFDVRRETDLYKPYSVNERKQIKQATDADIERYNALVQPYVLSGIGEDPYAAGGKATQSPNPLDNARWIFENKLGCKPIGFKRHDRGDRYHRYFLAAIQNSDKSIYEVYESWGVLYECTSRVIAPYITKLAQVTGLNADSLTGLEIDDFVKKHPATNKACLRYWKERSDGGKEYLLDLFKADMTWLTASQERDVEKIFNDVAVLTEEIRAEAGGDLKNKLFIFKSNSPRAFGQIKHFGSPGILSKSLDLYARDHGLIADSGEPLSITPARLRPSFVSELVERGVSIREIQIVLGHGSVATTIKYLEQLDFNRIVRKKINDSIKAIHAKAIEDRPADVPRPKVVNDQDLIFKTPFGGCRNILNPPEFIKKSKLYVPGRPCSLYNKCLVCENVIITVANLPELFAMRRDYLLMIETTRVLDTPYGAVVLENMDLLNKILEPECSDFSEEELAYAERLSQYVETNILVGGVTR